MFETFPSNDSHTALIFPLFLCTRKNVGNMKKYHVPVRGISRMVLLVPRVGTDTTTLWYSEFHAVVRAIPCLVRTVSCVGTSDMIRQLIILK